MRTIKEQGLTSIEAAEFLKQYGKNEVIGSQTQGLLQQFYKIILDPMGLMMLGLAVLYYFTGETTDASIILCAYVPVLTNSPCLKAGDSQVSDRSIAPLACSYEQVFWRFPLRHYSEDLVRPSK